MKNSNDMNWANIHIDSSGTPMATDYDDVYFSRNDGFAETEYVFLKGNNLPEAWMKKEAFTIIETGFGTGMNMLITALRWQKTACASQNLHFVSTEKHPIRKEELKALLEDVQGIDNIKQAYFEIYDDLLSGKVVNLFENMTLELLVGDIKETLPQTKNVADAWFLDGFSPAKNPEMWSKELFSAMASKSHSNTTVATFTAAGIVRRGLENADFHVERIKGYGYKRNMVIATFCPKIQQKQQ